MLFASHVAGAIILAILPLVFFVARYLAKRSKGFLWSLDDTLLVLSLLLLYLVVAAFFVTMIAGHVRQHIHTTTVANLRITLMVLWFRIPTACSLALTRCAITIFFIRTLFTEAYPWLKRIAYGCVFFAVALGLATILGILLHCRPIKYNFSVPFKNPRNCFNLEPFVMTVSAAGVALDALTWWLPHCVVWKLQLRVAHRIAITAIFAFGVLNIVIGGLRISAFTELAYGSDVTYGIGTTLIWAIAQISTGISVACCPHLRPVFEIIVPRRLTRVQTRKLATAQTRHASIVVTTRINLQDCSSSPTLAATFHDGHQEPWAPTFEVEQGPAVELQRTLCDSGCLHRGSCCL